jgi:hypothetical protein
MISSDASPKRKTPTASVIVQGKAISPNNLHISSFLIVKKKETEADLDYSILFLKAGDKHPLSFRREKLLLPATILRYGENPRDGAKRALDQVLANTESFDMPKFLTLQSFLGAHWDIVFVYEISVKDAAQSERLSAREPYTSASFYHIARLPRSEISDDHLDVIEQLLHPTETTP